MPLDDTHQHSSADIMQADNPHTPISPTGGTTTRASLGLATTDSPEFAGLNVGAATDTTLTRTGAGDIAVEGNALYRAGGTDVPVADGGTGASTGAGARTNLGLATLFNVTNYGAIGNGVADDQAAIQAAIDAAGAAGGGIVWLPKGTFLLTALAVPTAGSEAHLWNSYSDVSLMGEGAASILKATDAYSILYQGKTTKFVDATVRTLTGTYARRATSLTLATAGQASNFAVGDYIYIRTGQTIGAGGGGLVSQPDAEINRVVSSNAGTGVIGLAWPTAKPYAQEYFISGTSGVTSTSATANLAAFGVSNITSLIVKDQIYRDLRFEHTGTGTAYGLIGGQIIGCLVDNVQWDGNTGFQSIGAHRNYKVRDFRGHHPGAAGSFIYTLTADSGCTDTTWEGIEITGEHVVSVHMQEGCARVRYTNFTMQGPATVSDLNYISVRSRGYDHLIADGIIDGETPSALAVDPTVLGGGTVSNVQFLGTAGYGSFIAAPYWMTSGLRHPYGAKSWALGATGLDSDVRYLSAWVTKDNLTVKLGVKPANVYVKQVSIQVTEAFNSNGTDLVSVGFAADNAGFAAATDVSTTGFKTPTLGGYAGYSPGNHGDINAYYVAGGSAPSTGKAIVTFEYAPIPESP